MSRGLPKEVRTHLEKARESALLAVEVYNKPATSFRSGGHIILMVVGWTALFHAIFLKRKTKPFYRKKDSNRFVELNGDYKAWELAECVRQYFGSTTTPVRKNLEFFTGLRNKIEHRSMPELDHRIFGECQALLFNFEDLLFQEFGGKYAINESLALALQFSRLRDPAQAKAASSLHRPLRQDVRQYIDNFRSSLSKEDLHDLGFSYKVFLIPKLANHPGQADVAVEFVKYEPTKPDEMSQYNKIVALMKPSVVEAANVDRLLPGDVCELVKPVVQKVVDPKAQFVASYHHVAAYKYYKVRPKKGQGDPKKTDTKYCYYDEAHGDYTYTQQWVEFLKNEMKKPGQYEQVIKAYKD